MSIFDQQQDLENFSDQLLIQMGQQPDPRYPSYLVIAEIERRRDMRQRYEAEMAKHQAANPPDIATQRIAELGGIAGVDPAMGQQPPPEEMVALQGGIAGGPPPGMEQMGGPPPGMEQMGGPPPGMEGQPPMMAYGGLIPGYQEGGIHPGMEGQPPDEDGFLRGLWDEYGQPYMENIRDLPSRTMRYSPFTEEGRRRGREGIEEFERLSPEEQRQFMMEQIEGSGSGALEAFGPGAATKSLMSLGKAAWKYATPQRIRQAASTARATVGRHLPGQAIRGLKQASTVTKDAWKVTNDAWKVTKKTAEASRAASNALLKGPGSRTAKFEPARKAALKLAKKDHRAELVAKRKATDAKGLWDDAQGLVDEAIKDRGRLRNLPGGIAALVMDNKKKAAVAYAAYLRWRGRDMAAGGLIPGYQGGAILPDPDEDDEHQDLGFFLNQLRKMGIGQLRVLGDIPRVADWGLPEAIDFSDPVETWAQRIGQSGAARAREKRAELLDSMGGAEDTYGNVAQLQALRRSGKLSEAQYRAAMENQRKGYAQLPPGHWAQGENPFAAENRRRAYEEDQARIREEGRSDARYWVDRGVGIADEYQTFASTPRKSQIEQRKLWEDEATRETELLARELGLSTERVAELRSEMRTEKETDHARKARLFSGLGAALMGSPRNLGESLKGTTTGLEDLDEELRIERRRDLGDVYTQRARGLSAERSGRTGIRSLREKRYADIIGQEEAGARDVAGWKMDLIRSGLSASTQELGYRMNRDAQMARDRLTMGKFDPARWDAWEEMYGDLLRQIGDPKSPLYDKATYTRMKKQKYDFLVLGLDAAFRNVLTADQRGLLDKQLVSQISN